MPDETSVIGYDGEGFACYIGVPLTTSGNESVKWAGVKPNFHYPDAQFERQIEGV